MQLTSVNLATVVDALRDAVQNCRNDIGTSTDQYEWIDQREEDILRYQRLLDLIVKRHPHLKEDTP